jgi:hypothetical protein
MLYTGFQGTEGVPTIVAIWTHIADALVSQPGYLTAFGDAFERGCRIAPGALCFMPLKPSFAWALPIVAIVSELGPLGSDPRGDFLPWPLGGATN